MMDERVANLKHTRFANPPSSSMNDSSLSLRPISTFLNKDSTNQNNTEPVFPTIEMSEKHQQILKELVSKFQINNIKLLKPSDLPIPPQTVGAEEERYVNEVIKLLSDKQGPALQSIADSTSLLTSVVETIKSKVETLLKAVNSIQGADSLSDKTHQQMKKIEEIHARNIILRQRCERIHAKIEEKKTAQELERCAESLKTVIRPALGSAWSDVEELFKRSKTQISEQTRRAIETEVRGWEYVSMKLMTITSQIDDSTAETASL
eukprot:GDKJ01037389.1.p1 GENE.GDKJ01037389.1~~GDKJ01037389.1.p1  ORF type:complete len:264 (+),score=47.77 GDKJ01037389.1:68-859(+)